jgi:hypothetical protein
MIFAVLLLTRQIYKIIVVETAFSVARLNGFLKSEFFVPLCGCLNDDFFCFI